MKQICVEFESLHGILYILGAIDGSYIPNFHPKHRFYFLLLQEGILFGIIARYGRLIVTANYGIIALVGLDVYMIGYYFKNRKLE